MTLDEKIDETATPVAPYVLSIARVVIALMFMEPGTSKPFGFPAPTATPDPFTVVVRGDHRDRRRRAVAVCVYECIGRKILRHAWLNVDLIWTLALLLISGLLLLG
jgi:uncharacterized membrane protein YphA (DoxX/SURF4 family)